MYVELKLVFLILIAHLKVNILSATALIERNTAAISDQNSSNNNSNNNSNITNNNHNNSSNNIIIKNNTTFNYNNNNNNNINNNNNSYNEFVVHATDNKSWSPHNETFAMRLLINAAADNAQHLQRYDDNIGNNNTKNNNNTPSSHIVFTKSADDSANIGTNIDNHQQLKTTHQQHLLPTNQTTNEQQQQLDNKHFPPYTNASEYFGYELLQPSTVAGVRALNASIAPSAKTASAGRTTSMPSYSLHLPELPYTKSTSTTATTTTTTTTATTIDSDAFESADGAGFNGGGLNAINSSDIESFLLKYESDNVNACLMDEIKDVFLWWSYDNGSLRTDGFSPKSTSDCLDMSYHNLSDDDDLYIQVQPAKFLGGRNIVAFSAAHNNLTRAPFRTLSMLNDTLRYLTLKGNQFAAYSSEKQKEALTRLLNDTGRYSDGDFENNSTEDGNISINEMEALTIAYKDLRKLYKQKPAKLLKKSEEGIAWATFPFLPNLIELDISNCHIEYVTRDAFQNITNLRRLFISHNKMLTIPHDTFHFVPQLQYLDLSFTNVFDFEYHIPLPTLEAVIHLIYGVKIQSTTFKYLPELMFLDLSHTKLTRNSAMAFTHLSENMKYMSLCYTAFPMVGNALFKNTGLVGLDLSGNPYAAYNIIDDAFEGIADTLQYLYFQQSNLKDLSWLKYLSALRVLGLAGNNINSMSNDTFRTLKKLQVLDLSSNHVGNWYNSAFAHNQQLRVLNLRDNNINIINLEMLKDFQLLDYLSLGDNNFVCDCMLRDLVDIAAANNKEAECSRNVLQDAQNYIVENRQMMLDFVPVNETQRMTSGYKALVNSISSSVNSGNGGSNKNNNNNDDDAAISHALLQRYRAPLQRSYANLRHYNLARHQTRVRFVARGAYNALRSESPTEQCSPAQPVHTERINASAFKFQLLDYEDDHYWCFNETERMDFVQLDCKALTYDDNLAGKIHKLTTIVVATVCSVFGLTLLCVILYLRRWHIHYYYSSLKSAALMAVATKDQVNKFNELAEQDPNLVYDIFISYCQNDREWVLNELLPNVEEAGNISICLHERDFQIGVAILDNIISCMDRSRALMLIISSNFLLSHWCQFEMHLAQHRIFEVSKEHLIIVFLEDIPRSKRPKTLQYLMEVKTYIKWPGAKGKPVKPEERKFFWKRLKRSLEQLGVTPPESHA